MLDVELVDGGPAAADIFGDVLHVADNVQQDAAVHDEDGVAVGAIGERHTATVLDDGRECFHALEPDERLQIRGVHAVVQPVGHQHHKILDAGAVAVGACFTRHAVYGLAEIIRIGAQHVVHDVPNLCYNVVPCGGFEYFDALRAV